MLQHPLGQGRQRVEAFSHVRHPGGQPDLRLLRNRDHVVASPLANRSTSSTSKEPLTRKQCPEDSAISIRLSQGGSIAGGLAGAASVGSGTTATVGAVTSTGKKDAASLPGPNRGSRRQWKTMFAFRSCRRATAATDAPGSHCLQHHATFERPRITASALSPICQDSVRLTLRGHYRPQSRQDSHHHNRQFKVGQTGRLRSSQKSALY